MDKLPDTTPPIQAAPQIGKPAVPLWKNLKKFWVLYLMMLPAIVVLLINNYLPMFGIVIAFKNINYAKGFWESPWIGFENFKYLFSSEAAWVITRNTLYYNVVFIVLNTIIPVAFAIMFNEMRTKWMAKVHQGIMFLPYFLSMVVVSYLVYSFLGPRNGYLNTVVHPLLGLEPVDWYSAPEYWPYLLPIINTWKNVGYYTIIYVAAIIGIDQDYYEAAWIDGASKWKQITHITIPLLMPVITIMTLLQIGKIFYADFGLFFQVTRNAGALYPTTQVIDTYVYQTFLSIGDIGMSSAAGLYQALVGFVLILGTNSIVRRINKDNALF